MSQWAAITILGRDRPGIVAGVTRVLFEHGCNLEDSSATRLRDSFAMILIAKLPDPPRLGELRAALDALADRLAVGVDLRDLGDEPPQPPPAGESYLLAVYGADRPGIVYRVARELADWDCNLTDVTCRVAGDEAQPLYILMLEMTVPDGVDLDSLREHIQAIGRELSLDLSLRPVESETL